MNTDSFEHKTRITKVIGRALNSPEDYRIKLVSLNKEKTGLGVEFRGVNWVFLKGFKLSANRPLICKRTQSDVNSRAQVYENLGCSITNEDISEMSDIKEVQTRIVTDKGFVDAVIFGDEVKKFIECVAS